MENTTSNSAAALVRLL